MVEGWGRPRSEGVRLSTGEALGQARLGSGPEIWGPLGTFPCSLYPYALSYSPLSTPLVALLAQSLECPGTTSPVCSLLSKPASSYPECKVHPLQQTYQPLQGGHANVTEPSLTPELSCPVLLTHLSPYGARPLYTPQLCSHCSGLCSAGGNAVRCRDQRPTPTT